MVCPNCGTNNDENQKFCTNCGVLLSVTNEQQTVNNQQPVGNQQPVQNKESFINKIMKDKKKLIMIGTGVLALILLIIIAFGLKKCGKDDELGIDKIDDNALIIVKEDGKYGYINTKGKVVIKPKYDDASSFTGNFAVVKDDGKYKVIDKKGKVKFEEEYSSQIKYISGYNVWLIEERLYNSNLKALSNKGVVVSNEGEGYFSWISPLDKKAGIMNYKGKITYKYKFKDSTDIYFTVESVDAESSDKSSKKYCVTNVNNKQYAVVNCGSGKVIYKYTDNYVSNDEGTIYVVKSKDDSSFVEKFVVLNNKIVYKTDDKNINIDDHNDYVEIDNNGEKTYYLKKNGKKTKDKPESKSSDSDLSKIESYIGVTKFSCDNGYGLMKGDKVVVKCEWDSIKMFDISTTAYLKAKGKNYVLAKKDSKYYLINSNNGKKVKEFNTSSISTYSTSLFITYKDKDSSEKVVYNLVTGKSKTFDKDSSISLDENYFTVKTGDETVYYNTKFKSIYTIKK